MKVCLVQPDLAWQDRDANLGLLERQINGLEEPADLVVLPEMFTTGFTMAPEEFAEHADGPGFQWMKKMAGETGAVVCGSIATREDERFYNRLHWVRPDQSSEQYDKRHLFRMGREHEHYSAGKKKLVTTLGDWQVCPLVCYDLRFPVWSRCRFTIGANGKPRYEYDVLIYVANWPAVRAFAWKQLLIARAIENQCYVIGVNRCGADGNGVAHSGESMIVGPLGEIMASCDSTPQTRCVSLDRQKLIDLRERFPAALDADEFEIQV